MKAIVLILIGLCTVMYGCFVAASDEDDKHGYD